MLTLKFVRSIKADLPTAWQVIVDFPAYKEWNPFVTRCSAELQPGTPIVMQVNMGPFELEQTEQVTQVEHEKLFEYRMRPVGRWLYSKRQHRLEAVGTREIRYTSYFELRGWLSPIVTLLMGFFLWRGFRRMTNAVKTRAEALAP
ncbi:SRPBCC domain-containing protein [Luminiphilus sp. nBUS_07]|uniref:SRPBCC domain-containing protein n=1 Tax=Luminiphilus sp. nBUS_07 TaxID=3395314 RepID=UPI003EB9FBF7